MSLLRTFIAFGFCVCAGAGLRADPIPLAPGDSVNYGGTDALTGTSMAMVAGSPFSALFTIGQVDTRVYTGVDQNPYFSEANPSVLTFVYSVSNLLSEDDSSEGIVDFIMGGWTGYNTSVALGNQFGDVPPASATRSSDGATIDFSFPPGNSAPPIYNGQTGMDLIVFTDATTWAQADGTIQSILASSTPTYDVSPVGPGAASVPDSGTTALQAGLGFALCLLAARRSRAKK